MNQSTDTHWQVWIDTGGTFTDCLAIDPRGALHRAKVLSTSALRGRVAEVLSPTRLRIAENWNAPRDFVRGCAFAMLGSDSSVPIASYDPEAQTLELERAPAVAPRAGAAFEARSPEEAPVLAARLVTHTPHGASLPALRMRLGTTRGTNALLEGKGVAPVLFITEGFADLLEIGTQARPHLFALDIVKPRPLHACVVEVPERLSASGEVLRPLDVRALDAECERLLRDGHRVAAVALMHSYLNPLHEEMLAEHLRAKGFAHVSKSSELAPSIRLLPRAQTAVVNAFLAPVIDEYLARVAAQCGPASLRSFHVMTSAGGLVTPESYRAKDSLLSGPAGGVVGAATAGAQSGFERLIAFDMGGTSTDVSRRTGDFAYVFEHTVGDAWLMAPALAIETVAAGGGSICRFDGTRLRVGPESAGAHPGPACYGAGGPLTVTDVNLLLGRLEADGFEIPVDEAAARARLEEIRAEVNAGGVSVPTFEELLEGFLAIANERMADAIRRVSVREGYDPADYVLVSFGGAGGQHACAIAELLGMATVLVPRDASLLSAFGLGHAVVERFAEWQVLRTVAQLGGELPALVRELEGKARALVQREGAAPDAIDIHRRIVNCRFLGQDSTVAVETDRLDAIEQEFHERFRGTFGYRPEQRDVEIESIRVVASTRSRAIQQAACCESVPVQATRRRSTWIRGAWREIRCDRLAALPPGATAGGPALVVDRHTTVFVEEGWRFRLDGAGNIVCARSAVQRRPVAD